MNQIQITDWQQRVAIHRDQAAYRSLFMHFAVAASRFSASITHCDEASEEIYCDVMMKIWDMNERLLNVDNFRLYLFRAIRNASFNYLRSKKNTVLLSDQVHEAPAPATADQQLIASEFQKKLHTIVDTFSIQCAAVYRLVKEDGFSYKETAALLNISVNTVEFHMKNALSRLRLGLSDYLTPQKK